MRWPLMLQLLQLLLQLRMVQSQSLEGRSQETIPLFRLTQQGVWDSLDRRATDSPCEGLPAAGTTALNLANRSLERLPSCLPRTLRSLDGSHNLLRALGEPVLGRLPELRVLTLHHNRISVLHWGRGTPAGLRELDLSHNLLAELPPCAAPSGSSLRSLALAGNPLRALPPRTFACFPALQLLNLSCSELGHIAPEAFAGEDGGPLAALELLDLSGSSLERVESGWIRNLPKLKFLYLRKMPRLKTLEGDIFKMTPHLQQLDCQGSPALSSVHTEIFQDTPDLQVLQFQHCNLSSFGPWTVNSSQVLSVSLFGNPLTCSCELAWLLVDVNKTVLHRATDTMCEPALGYRGPFSGPLSLPHLSDVCRSDQSTTLLASNPLHFDHSVSAPRTQGPSTGQSMALSAQPGGSQQNITKVPSLTIASPTQGSKESAQSTTNSEAVNSPSGALPGAASSGAEQIATHILEPSVSSASTPLVSKYLEPLPTSPNPRSVFQTNQKTHATPQALHTDPPQDEIPVLLLDDSEEEETQDQVAAPLQDGSCDYHPCKHLQTPCAELQRRFRCRCPGLSGEDTIPDPPTLQGVSEVTDTSVLIHWCAPNSVVLWYQIHYFTEGGSGNQSIMDIYATARQHPLYKLSPGTTYRVCILAANRAGLSQPQVSGWRRSCATFTTKSSSVVIFWGLCTASALLLVSTLVLSVCLWRQRWKPHRQFYGTHLVAFKNPARAEEVTQW
ncbi:leucine-rich repeat neuronal protein 4 [Apodemus sylvaticus]|uniref:leucine-rich repeat neuronal protein 4 n=1 Tax=Apodemus sylvaticus TaxID=10129 RepID=UPI0022445D45|nr:leucine-rich repeat neuronal protein 4 [Apodemus sylvaticus]XP_052039673.1 leucine-rich repeat neuronal protein 4 [Apodemus sylvaticus]